MPTPNSEQLHSVLERARTVGFLGPGPLRVHEQHSAAFTSHIPADARRLIDLGSGGGVPGLPIFVHRSDLGGVLLDTSEKRCTFLQWAVAELSLQGRVEVVHARAEEAAHLPEHREQFDVATARGFAPPSETTECATGFLRPGGVLIISEPPEQRTWLASGLASLALIRRETDPTTDQPTTDQATADQATADQATADYLATDGPASNSGSLPRDPEPAAGGPDRTALTVPIMAVFERTPDLDPTIPRPWRRQQKRPTPVTAT